MQSKKIKEMINTGRVSLTITTEMVSKWLKGILKSKIRGIQEFPDYYVSPVRQSLLILALISWIGLKCF